MTSRESKEFFQAFKPGLLGFIMWYIVSSLNIKIGAKSYGHFSQNQAQMFPRWRPFLTKLSIQASFPCKSRHLWKRTTAKKTRVKISNVDNFSLFQVCQLLRIESIYTLDIICSLRYICEPVLKSSTEKDVHRDLASKISVRSVK